MQDFNLCKAAVIGMSQCADGLKTKLLKHRFAVRAMKLTAFFMFICLLEVSAKVPAQERITIKEKGATLINIFTKINKQTGYNFLFTSEDIKFAKPVDIDVKNASLKDVLDICFKNQELTYKISAKIISVQVKKSDSPPVKENGNSSDEIKIHGKVVDENGKPVAGVTVTVKGTKKQTITDENGEFTIPGVEANAVLAFSSVNMEAFEIRVDGKAEILAKLKTKTSELDEVQIIAYGQTTKRLQTGNVTTVKGEDIAQQPISNPLLALEGRVPGLLITQNSGVPGGGVTVRIQGQNSIDFGNDPLIIIDGVPYVSQNLITFVGPSLGNSGVSNGNPLSYVNPADIESIEVLKDADATAIYGSRAANGAILITTKKGRVGSMKIDVNLQHGWGKVAHFIDLMNSTQYMQMRNEAKINSNAAVLSSDYDLNGLWDTTRYTDWQKVLIGGTAHYRNYTATISGGTSNIQYLLGSTYHSESTVFPGDFIDKKASVYFNINSFSSNQRFHLQVSGNYLDDNSNLPGRDFTQDIFLAPVAPKLYNSDGTLNWAPDPSANGNSSWTNPLSYIYNLYDTRTTNILGNAILEYRILPGLNIKSSFGYNTLRSNEFIANLVKATPPENVPNYVRSSFFTFNNLNSWIIEPQLTYRKDLGKGRLDFLIGSTIQRQDNDGKQISASGQPNDQLLKDITSATSLVSLNADISTYKYIAGFGRLNYSWRNKYILNLTGRRDGSSRFGDRNKFHSFYSIGGAWIFSEEKLVQKTLTFLSFGKFRASYGTTGSDQVMNYSYLNLYYPVSVSNPYQASPSLTPGGLTNPYLQWEETRKLQVGADLGVLKDKILVSATYVRNRSSNQLLDYSLPNITGFTQIKTNFPALIQNTAWEFSISTKNVRSKNIQWSTSINLTIPKNKLVEFPDLSTSSYSNRLIVGKSLQIIKTYPFYGVDPVTGNFQVKDHLGNPTSSPDYLIDRTVIIDQFAKFYGGFQNKVEYLGFEVDFMLQFTKQTGNNILQTYNTPGEFASGNGNQPITVLSRWRKPGDVTNYERYASQYLEFPQGDRSVMDVSYIRMKNLAFSYKLSEKLIQKIHLTNFRIYLNAQNVFTITSYKGLDPENLTLIALPPLRVVTLGIQATF